ncbi:MAG: PQQ-binding-like beta-propeller repeat protein [Bauldia sp.]|nr:PQQ-binding-like beta-propeller repeat protein [Bauldia sp.]
MVTPAAADVTYERLLNADAEPQNWLTNHGNYSAHRHSGLDMINRDNVGGLRLAYAVAVSGVETGNNSMQGTPLVDDGAMYITDGWGVVTRIDVSSGDRGLIQWEMNPGVDPSEPGIRANRGVALFGDNVYSVSFDGRLLQTAAATGELLYDIQATSPDSVEYLTVAPLALEDKLVIGVSGADSGIRGWIDAYDTETGEQAWRRWIIPAPGEPGSETWKDDWNAWQTGGGSGWVTGSYDPDNNIVIWGTGNPAPDFDASYRPGDNLYTNSALGLDGDTGEIVWYFQYTPNDSWDYDEVGVHTLIDLEVDGQMRRVVAHSARNGFYYTLDAGTGEFVNGVQYVLALNWTAGLDPKTGMPVEYVENADFQPYAGVAPTHDNPVVEACPTIGGGNNYFPSAYNPATGLYYIVGTENCSRIDQIPFNPGDWVVGDDPGFGAITPVNAQTNATLTAVDVATGTIATQIVEPYANYSGILSTAGGLIFSGYLDGSVKAYNDETLEELWSVNLGTPLNAPPMSFAVNGDQYVAILAGVGFIARGNLVGHPEVQNIRTTSMLFVFGL